MVIDEGPLAIIIRTTRAGPATTQVIDREKPTQSSDLGQIIIFNLFATRFPHH